MTTPIPQLTLIDGSSYLFRAFHALPPLTNAAGEPTGALFGVVNMLRATLNAQPDYAAFVLDAGGPNFRHALYPDYKANRPPMPEDLRAQIEPMCRIVEALGLPLIRVPEVEADDVIGTLALQAAAEGIHVTISTGDKDFAQLVRPGIALVNTMSGSRMDSDEAVREKFGVSAAQIVDLLTLMGDSVDNIPGVPKCGPKTAAKWLGEYGDLDALIAHADAIKGKIGESLRAALPQLPLSRELATIKTDVALDQRPRDLHLRPRDDAALRELYARYGFTQALRDLDQPPALKPAPSPAASTPIEPALSVPGTYETILTEPQLQAWIATLSNAGIFAIDTETDALDAMQAGLVGISFAAEPGHAAYLPLAHTATGTPAQLPQARALALLRPLLEDPSVHKIAQNGKYDLHILRRHGIELAGFSEDTLLESFILDAGSARHDLDSLAQRHLGYTTITYEDVAGKGARQISFAQVDLDTATRYAAEDADITLRLHHLLRPRLTAAPAQEAVYRDIEIPLIPVLARIEAHGVKLDTAELHRQTQDLSRRMLSAQQQAYQLAGRTFNLDSPKQLQALLFDELKLPALVKTPKGQPSTNEEALDAIADQHPLPRIILDYRSLAKLRSTYTEKLPAMLHPGTGRLHTSYHQSGAATGRLSSSDPNLQNIPIRTEDGRRIRKAFIAEDGWRLVACDYSQIELRIMAHLSEDAGLLSAFASGADIHKATAAEVFGRTLETVTPEQRRAAKAINFGLMYGMSAFGLARNLGISRSDAQDYISTYFARYPGVRDFMQSTREQARERGYVETVFGRRLYLDYISKGTAPQRAGAERAAINAPMQGTAADIIKRAMIDIDAWLATQTDRARMILQVHDELVFEVREAFVDTLLEGAVARMSAAAQLRVPLVVDAGVGGNWDQAH